jgi:hypothetical protein
MMRMNLKRQPLDLGRKKQSTLRKRGMVDPRMIYSYYPKKDLKAMFFKTHQ